MSNNELNALGARYRGFVVTRYLEIPELQLALVELLHESTGARVLHLGCDDDENLFCLSFRTWPKTSNGVAHILEHTVLCGSKQFPVRDPFFAMTRRSLNTFMNALTGADFTCYPASSQVPKDFYNLLDVYIDSVFHPLLDKKSFLQEGHRLEFKELENPASPLCYKGIVFNEMKGALANPDTRLNEMVMETLFPDLTYGINSGGDPKEIPNLTYDELKSFHETFYHPSQCLFFFYGDLPLKGHLDVLEEKALKGVSKQTALPLLSSQPRFKQNVFRTGTYPVPAGESLEEKTMIGMGWLTCHILDQMETLGLAIIDLVLMGTDASPLKMALLKSGLCKQTDAALEVEMSEIPYLLVCKGCKEDAAEPLVEVIRSTFEKTCQEGLPAHLVEGAIHQLELARFEITGGSSPYGLSLFFRAALLHQHGGLPEDGLMIHTLFKNLRAQVQDLTYLVGLIRKHFLDNPHFVCVTLNPDPELSSKEEAFEQEKLNLLQASLSDHTKQLIIEQAKELQRHQEEEEEEDFDILPKISLKDVPEMGKEFPLLKEPIGPWTLYAHPCFTNEILYVDVVYDLPEIAEQDLAALRLFSLFLPQVGRGGKNYKEHLDELLQHTGGIAASLDLGLQVSDPHQMRPSFSLKAKSLYRKADRLFPILKEIITSADFTDKERLQELLMQHFHGVKNSISNHPLRYAVNLAASGLSIPSKLTNSWFGLDYYFHLKQIVENFEKNPSFLIAKLEDLKEKCLGLKGGDLVLGGDQKILTKLQQNQFYGFLDVPQKAFPKWKNAFSLTPVPSQGRVVSSPVAFTTLIFPSLSYLHAQSPALSLSAEIMDNVSLHKKIREQGGAYGSGAVSALLSGQFYFYSYRDPHLTSTIQAFEEAAQEISKGDFEERELEEAKLVIVQDLDSPCPPGSRSITAYSRLRSGRTPEIRQYWREKLLQTTSKEVEKATKEHVKDELKKGVLISFASQEFFDKEGAKFHNTPLPIFPVDPDS